MYITYKVMESQDFYTLLLVAAILTLLWERNRGHYQSGVVTDMLKKHDVKQKLKDVMMQRRSDLLKGVKNRLSEDAQKILRKCVDDFIKRINFLNLNDLDPNKIVSCAMSEIESKGDAIMKREFSKVKQEIVDALKGMARDALAQNA